MNEDSKKLIDDCFLRPIADPRGSSNKIIDQPPESRGAPLKSELQVLRLGDETQKQVLDVLRTIHGTDFVLGEITDYKDRGSKTKNKYWQDRGNLVIQGGYDYSAIKSGDLTTDRFRMYAIMKLESYGFPKSHCIEALEVSNSDMDSSLELLYSKYFKSPHCEIQCDYENNNYTENELIELRNDEKSALESIYDNIFEEKEKNTVWVLKFNIDHLLKYSPSEVKKKLEQERKEREKELAARMNKPKVKKPKSEKCRNFFKNGKCRYGDKCLYLHKLDSSDDENNKTSDKNSEKMKDDANSFYLEIRFPKENKYPYEAPLVCLKTTCPDIPHDICLRLTRHLLNVARELAQSGMPSVYTMSESLQHEEEILEYLKNDRSKFLDPRQSIYQTSSEGKAQKIILPDLPTHHQKGSSGKSEFNFSLEQKTRENRILVDKFMKKQSNPNYISMLKSRRDLPAWNMITPILEILSNCPVIVISGETGCGKSTQVPQFILDDWMLQSSQSDNNKMQHVEIVCTQPRKISAIGVAKRVADERNEAVGNVIGYQIRLENKISSSTRLTFCTTGILLRRLQSDPLLKSISHVIVDEVHERSEESDFLLLLLKEVLAKRPDFKIILMSATLNPHLFSKYFEGAPVIEIPGRTFPVEQLFLEDILDLSNFVLEPDSQFCKYLNKKESKELLDELEYCDIQASNQAPAHKIRDENLSISEMFARYSDNTKSTCRTLFLMDPMRINPELIESILNYIVEGEHKWPKQGTILIFLPGFQEIQTIYDTLMESIAFGPKSGKYLILPLHSTLTSEEQGLIFKRAPAGKRKIILSTNIAETSVTIDDCVYVIDCGQMKEKRFDPNRNMESLELVWVSRANAQQRKGRAGRVMSGVAIHLFTRHRFNCHLLSQPVPEIQRVPLEQLLLRIKTSPNFKNMSVMSVLSGILESPTDENILSAVKRLQDVGAFDMNENLTPLGHHLSELPVDVRIGKFMLFGAMFQCLDSVLTIAACLSFKSPFVTPFNKKAEANNRKSLFAICNSDHLTALKAYRRWQEATKRSKYAGKVFADENFLSWKTLESLIEIKFQFLELLVSIGFVPVDLTGKKRKTLITDEILSITGTDMNINGDNNRLLAALICASLYPNVVKVLTPEKSFTMSAGGAVPRQPLPNELRFKTRDDGYVALHPSSINASVGHFPSPFLVFQEKVKTSRIFIRDCTMVPLLPLVLFSGSDMKIELHGGDFIILLEEGWIMIKAASHEVAEMMKWLRIELAKILEEKIKDPCLNLLNFDNGKRVLSIIVQMITKE